MKSKKEARFMLVALTKELNKKLVHYGSLTDKNITKKSFKAETDYLIYQQTALLNLMDTNITKATLVNDVKESEVRKKAIIDKIISLVTNDDKSQNSKSTEKEIETANRLRKEHDALEEIYLWFIDKSLKLNY
jgi:hypothetical protein